MDLVVKSLQEIAACIALQAKVCAEKNFPHFAPESGTCWACRRNIYQNYRLVGIFFEGRVSVGKTGENPITGCPHCNRSYCD